MALVTILSGGAAAHAEAVKVVEDRTTAAGIRERAMIELHNKRISYLTNRVIQLENVITAMLDSNGQVANMRIDGIAQAGQTFPQIQTAASAVHFAAIATRDKRDAVDDYVADINAGNNDNPVV